MEKSTNNLDFVATRFQKLPHYPWNSLCMTSKLSYPTSMTAHSFSTYMTSCWLDQLGKTV
jgi:hypothetical protein